MENATIQAGAAEPALAKASFLHLSASHRRLIDSAWAQALEKNHLPAFSKTKSRASSPLPLFLAAF